MTRLPSRMSRLFRLFGELGNAEGRRRAGRRQQPATSEQLESRVVLSATYVPNHVLLSIDQAPTVDELGVTKSLANVYPGSVIEPLGDYGVFLVTLPSNVDAMAAITNYRGRAGVKTAEPDWIGEWSAVPNDPNFDRMWGLQNIGQTVNGNVGTAGADIDADIAWDKSTGDRGTLVAIVDSGVDYLHPDLAANIWANTAEIVGNGIDDDGNGYVDDVHGYDFGSDDGNPMDFVGHGTHVAGTVGAVGNNGIGTVGVNWNVSMMALKIGTDFGGPTNSGAIAAINYAVAMGAVVSNHSYGVNPTVALENAIINARDNDHIVVIAAGNNGLNNDGFPTFPNNYTQDNIVAVAATDQDDRLASFSNYGRVSVDIGAPGVNIWSTTPTAGSLFYGPNYDYSDGTSMAAPAVTGAIALMRSVAPSMTYTEIIGALYQGVDQLPSLNGRVSTGGRLNLDQSLQLLSPASITISPSTIAENAGNGAASITIQKEAWPLDSALTVSLAFDDATEVRVPALAGGSSITIPAGQSRVVLPVDILDDTLYDGVQTVTFTISQAGNVIDREVLRVTDVETLTMTVTPSTIREDAGNGAGSVTITRSNTDTAAPNTFAVVNNRLLEHNAAGTQVSSRTIPWPAGARPAAERARDVVVMEDGRVAVYNGTTTSYLSILNRTTNLWQHIAVPGLTSEAAVAGSGGITSSGNFVFLSDMSTSSPDPYGVVRVDVTTGATTRFANQSLGYRIFVKDIFADNIIEIDLKTGATINTIPMPPLSSNFGFNNGLAFDGANLWVLAGPTNNNLVYKLDANTGTVLEVHGISGAGEWDGLAWLNDQLYLLNNFVENQITVYDPVQRRVTNTLNVGAINNIDITGGLAAIKGPDRLIVTSTFGDIVYEINPVSGVVTNEWRSGMSTTEYGVGVANGEIYIGEFIGGSLRIFNRAGVFQRSLDVDLSGAEGVYGIGGDDIQTLVPTDFRYRDIYSGLDDKFYVLDKAGTDIGRFNPQTLALEEFFKLARPVNAIAVAADGTVWGAGGDGILYHFDETGAVIGQRTIGSVTLVDIDLNVTGQILVTSSAGRVYRTNTSLATPTSFSAGSTLAYASLGRHQSLPAGDLIVNLINSDPTEVSLPSTVVIPVGQRSVTIPLNAVDDKILDGTQSVTISASANGYTGTPSRTISVTDAESIAIDILATEISEAAGKNATQARLTRSNTDGPFTHLSKQSFSNGTDRTILDFDKTLSQITVPSQTSQLIDVNVTLTLFHSDLADLDIFLVSPNGTRVELVTDIVSNEPDMTGTTFDDNANEVILDGMTPFTGRFRPEGSLLDLNGENPSGRWTLEITDDNINDFGTLLSWSLDIETMGLAPLTVALTPTGDTNEISAPRTVIIPANQTSVLVPIDAVDDALLDGTRTSGLRTSTTTAGYVTGSDTVRVTDSESLTFNVNRTSVSEAAGNGAVTGTITRSNTDISSSFTVNVFSNDPTELSVPATVTIPAGAKSVTFPINAVDDNVHDGSQTVTIRVSAAAYGADKSRVITVTDLEPSLKVSASKTTGREDAGTIQVTVTRQDQSDLSRSMAVNLAVINVSQGTDPLTVPAVVTIPANRSSVTFNVTVNNDNLLDGTQTATIRARGTGITEGSTVFTVTDHETLSLTFEDTTLREDNGAKATRGTVRRSNINIALPLVVTLTSSDVSELKIPAKVTIPAGSNSVSFDVDTLNDSIIDGTQSVTITAVATGYVNGTGKISVADHEPPVLTGPAAAVTTSKPAITWKAVAGALRYDVLLRNLSSGIEQLYTGITKTSFTRTEPLGIGRYRVYVRAIDQLERAGFWSSLRDFKVETAPKITAPVIKPQVGSTFPEISWTAVIDAAGYELVVHNVTTGKKNVISEKNLRTTSFRSPQSLGSGTYTAYVRAFNAKKEFGKWTPAYSFTVLGTPTVVTPVSGGTFDRIPLISWTAVAGATSYDVHLSNRTTGAIVFRDQHVTGTSVRVPRDLADGEYRLGVQAQFGDFYGNWSTSRYFSVGTSPVTTSPENGAHAGAKPKFVWTAISGAERYELHVRNLDTNAVVLLKTDLTTTTYTMTSTLPLANYRVYVRAVSTMGEFTAWNKRVDFIGGATPKVTSPVSNAKVAAKPTVAWSEVSGAVSYQVWIRDQETMKWVLKASNIKTNSYTLKTGLDSGNYRVWVRAVSAKGQVSAWSTGVDFRVSDAVEKTPSGNPSVETLLVSALNSAGSEQQTSDVVESTPEAHPTSSVTTMDSAVLVSETVAPVRSQELDAARDMVMAGWDASEWWVASAAPVAEFNSATSVTPTVTRQKADKI